MRVRRERIGCEGVRCEAQEVVDRSGPWGSDCQEIGAVSPKLGMLIGTHMGEHWRYGEDGQNNKKETEYFSTTCMASK